MATTIKEFLVELGVETDTDAVDNFNSSLGKMKDAAGNIIGIIGKMATTIGALGGTLFAVAKKVADTTIRITRQAKAVGVARETYQGLVGVFRRFGLESRDVKDALSVLSDRAEDAMRGTQGFVEAFGLIGIEAEELRGLAPEEIFFKTAEALRNAESDVKRLTAAERLLGGELGQKLMPVFQQGNRSIREMTEQMADLRAIVGDDMAEASKKFEGNMFLLKQAFQGLKLAVGGELIPVMNNLLDQFIEWFRANDKIIRQKIRETVRDLADIVKNFARNLPTLISQIQSVVDWFGGWGDAAKRLIGILTGLNILAIASNLVTLISGISGAISALGGLISVGGTFSAIASATMTAVSGLGTVLAALSGPVGIAIAAIIGLTVVFDDIMDFLHGRESVTGSIVRFAKQAVQWFEWLAGAVQRKWNSIKQTISSWGPTFASLVNFIESRVEQLQNIFALFSNFLTGNWGKMWGNLKDIFWTELKSMKQLWNSFMGAVNSGLEMIGVSMGENTLKFETKSRGASAQPTGRNVVNSSRQVNKSVQQKNEINIHPREGMSEEKVGEIAAEKVSQKQSEVASNVNESMVKGGER